MFHILAAASICWSFTIGSVNGNNDQYLTVCMVDDQSQYRPDEGQFTPHDITHVDMCTHLVYNHAMIGESGTGLTGNGEYEEDNYRIMTALKGDRPSLKVLLGIGGPQGSLAFNDVVNSTESVDLFLEGVLHFVRDRYFDGVVIDIGGQNEETGGNLDGFDLLLYGMASTFQNEADQSGKPRLLIGVAVAGDRQSIDTFYPLESIANYADLVFVNGYDLYTPDIPIIGHQSALFSREDEDGYLAALNVDFAIRYLLYSGIPASKLILGIPSHGKTQRFFNESQQYFGADSSGPGSSGPYSKTPGSLAYYEICQLIGKGWVESFHEGHQVPYAFTNDEIVTYDNADSIPLKINYIKDSQLGGVFISSLGDDDFKGLFCNQGHFPLTKSLHEYIHRARDNCYPGEYGSLDLKGCTPCPLGTYQPELYQTQCLPCPERKTTLTLGAIEERQCVVDCPPGSEYSFFPNTCTDCPLGFHRETGVQAYCVKCADGKTTVKTGSSQCVEEPESVEQSIESRVDVNATMAFHVMSCENKPVLLGIILQLVQEFIFDLSSTWQALCTEECGNVQFAHIKECHADRQKRETHEATAAPSEHNNNIEITMILTNVSQDVRNDQHVRRVDKVLAEAFSDATAFSSLDVYGVSYLHLTDLSTTVVCSNGSTSMNKATCSQCTKGMFHNMTSSLCEWCPVGTYQDEEGMTSCEPCQGARSTMTSGSTSSIQCISPCEAKPNYCYNSGLCHWNEGDSSSIYCQCVDGYVGDRCESAKDEYLDSSAIIGISIAGVSAFLYAGLIVTACVFCISYRRTRRRCLDVAKRDMTRNLPNSPSAQRITSISKTALAPHVSKGSRFVDYFDYHSWLYGSHSRVPQQDVYLDNIQQQQQHRFSEGSGRIPISHSMPQTSEVTMYGMTLPASPGTEHRTVPRMSMRGNGLRSMTGEY